MKKTLLVFLSCLLISATFSQSVVFSEDFNYPTGASGDSVGGGLGTTTALGDTIWKKHSGTATGGKCIKYTTSPLSLAGYAGSNIGGAITFQHTAGSADINGRIGFFDSTVGSLYTAFLLKVDTVTGRDTTCDYFFHYCDLAGAGSLSNFRGRLFLSPGSDSSLFFKIGLSKGTVAKPAAGINSPIFTSSQFNLHQTYLVIVKYTFNGTSGDKNDEIKLFVISGAIPNVEPAADVTFTDPNQSDLKQIQSICIRQGSIGRAFGTIDGIRVFKTWDAATIALLPIQINSFNAVGLKNTVNLNWNVLCTETGCKFSIERSVDGTNFDAINTISNVSSVKNYSFTDNNLPNTKTLYYRLKVINSAGKSQYSAIQKVNLRDVKLTVSPNPVVNEILINATNNISKVEVYNLQGKLVITQSANSNFVKISTTNLANGSYVVKSLVDGISTSETIVVKH